MKIQLIKNLDTNLIKGIVLRNAFELNLVNRIFFPSYWVKLHLYGIYLKEFKGIVSRNAFELNLVNRKFFPSYWVKLHLYGIFLKEFQFFTT